ncbi:hypothetical protein HK096_007818, partial [Nowakowskiella sp. JEL0078]
MAITTALALSAMAYYSAKRKINQDTNAPLEEQIKQSHNERKKSLSSYLLYPVDKVGKAVVSTYDYFSTNSNSEKE